MKCIISTVIGQFNDQQIKQLEAVLRGHYKTHVSDQKLTIIWVGFQPEQAFTNYQPSRSSIVTMECAADFPQPKRVELLKACAADWGKITGQHPDELMLSLVEPDLFAAMMRSNRERLSAIGKIRMGLHLIRSLPVARIRRGFLAVESSL